MVKILEQHNHKFRVLYLSADSAGDNKPGDRPPTLFLRDRLAPLHPRANVLEWINYYNRLHRYNQIRNEENKPRPQARSNKNEWLVDYVITWRR